MSKRRIIDISMTILMPLLMCYSLIGETGHEVAGVGMLVLFILHHFMNRGWWKSLGKGSYKGRRVVMTMVDLALVFLMVMQPVSGIILSRHLFTFIQISHGTEFFRSLHLTLAHWSILLISIHIGLHLPMIKVSGKTKTLKWIILGSLSLLGIWSFIHNGFLNYMFLQQSFFFVEYGTPVIWKYIQYLSVMTLFSFGTCLIICLERSHKEFN